MLSKPAAEQRSWHGGLHDVHRDHAISRQLSCLHPTVSYIKSDRATHPCQAHTWVFSSIEDITTPSTKLLWFCTHSHSRSSNCHAIGLAKRNHYESNISYVLALGSTSAFSNCFLSLWRCVALCDQKDYIKRNLGRNNWELLIYKSIRHYARTKSFSQYIKRY